MLDAINQETRSKTKAPITGIFAGKIKNCLKSECGKYSRQNVEDCKELMLDLGDNKTIEAAISQFISASELTGDNKWKPAAGVSDSLLCLSALGIFAYLMLTTDNRKRKEVDGPPPAATYLDDPSQEVHVQLRKHAAGQGRLQLYVPTISRHVTFCVCRNDGRPHAELRTLRDSHSCGHRTGWPLLCAHQRSLPSAWG